jgi:hypothetical protein
LCSTGPLTKDRPRRAFNIPPERSHSPASFNALPELHRYLRRMLRRSIAVAVAGNSSAALRMLLTL